MWRHQTQGWLVLLLLTLTAAPSLGEGIPSLPEAVKLQQMKEIETLNRILADKDAAIQKKEEENENLRKKISEQQEENESLVPQHLGEKSAIEEEIKGSKVLVEFVMNVLHHSEEIMRESEAAITRQSEILEKTHDENEECKQKNHDNTKFMFQTQETIRLQNDKVEKLKSIIKYSESLNASYHDMEDIKPSDCDLPTFVTSMAKVLSDQQEIRRDLKASLEEDQMITEFLDIIQTEITKKYRTANQYNEQWVILRDYQNTIRKQSKSIGDLRTLASSGVNMISASQYKEDESGNLVSGSSCQCLPQLQNGTQVSVVLESQDQKMWMSMWSPWEYQDCFEWMKADNSTVDCGLDGRKVRHRVKELDSVSWEQETEEEGCVECVVPGIQDGSWSEWSKTCSLGSNKRWRLGMSGHTLETTEDTRECVGHPQCLQPYKTLSDDWRKISYKHSSGYYRNCDKRSGFTEGWHRFSFNGTNAKIPTKVAPERFRDNGQTCGTYTTAWMEGSLPTVGDSPKNVTLKFTRRDGSNRDTKDALVVACLGDKEDTFYLYHLSVPRECDLAYCAETNVDVKRGEVDLFGLFGDDDDDGWGDDDW